MTSLDCTRVPTKEGMEQKCKLSAALFIFIKQHHATHNYQWIGTGLKKGVKVRGSVLTISING